MKVFGENQLGGEVSFECSPGRTTTFTIALPAQALSPSNATGTR